MVSYGAGANIESFSGICGTTKFKSCGDVPYWFSDLVILVAHLGFSKDVVFRVFLRFFVCFVLFCNVLFWGFVGICKIMLPSLSEILPLAVFG